MKALLLASLVTPDDLRLADVPMPEPASGEVLVRLRAAALNHRDLHMFNFEPERACILGSDGAGVVAAVGAGVTGWTPGAEVLLNPSLQWGDRQDTYGAGWSILGWPRDGTLAEAIALPAECVFAKPPHLSFEEASALPLAGLTAYRALAARARVGAGETVLVHGIGGGVALFALQFARALGARVMVTSTSNDKLARAQALGAELGVNSRTVDWAAAARDWTGGAGVDVVVESLGGDYFARSLEALRLGGRLVTFGRTVDTRSNIDLHLLFWHQLSLLGSTMGSPADFARMLALVSEHHIRPVIDSVWPLEDGCHAFERLAQGKQFGKIVLTCA
ncbi:MAG: zinc-binding dehydrogenase [Anaerolineales bacterium]|nr:zinc-binding dehydrogenase [Anaerolineales bacterium]